MSRLADRMFFHVLSLGRVGALGALLVVGALLADAGLLRPMEQRLDALVTGNQRAMLVPAEARRLLPASSEGERPALEPEADEALRRIFNAADAAGIELARGDYRLVHETGVGYRTYQFTLPLSGDYPAIREFVAGLLAEEPALSLNSLLVRRDSIETPQLEAILRFTLYLEAGA